MVRTRYTFQQLIEVPEYTFLQFVWQQTKKVKVIIMTIFVDMQCLLKKIAAVLE
jgi:hypothetical protein